MPLSRQLSLFGVEARPASPLDFEGLLAGAGQVVCMGGTARVSIVVEDPWRARALLVEADLRGIPASCARVGDTGQIRFRTAYSRALAPLGRAWLRSGQKRAPAGLVLDGRRLRLWAIAAGGPDGAVAFTLRQAANADAKANSDPDDGGEPDDGGDEAVTWEIVGAGLAAAGLPAVLLTPRAGGPAYRIVGRRRLARLAELVGEAPAGAPPGGWV